MQNLGHTRSSLKSDHYLQTPDTFVRAPLPGMSAATAIVHAAPATGARFVQYTAEMQEGGQLATTANQRFLYVLDGILMVAAEKLSSGGYAYIPAQAAVEVRSETTARVSVIEKPYTAIHGFSAPDFFRGNEEDVPSHPLMGDSDLQVRALVPDNCQFDFAVNTMTFRPGATLSMVEIHVMEHGLLMLEGGGIYRLGDAWYPVTAGDFIYMAPFCPQWFGALGKTQSKYLVYKDWNRQS